MGDPSIDIRNAVPDDIEHIADIWRHYVSNSIANFEEKPPTTDEVRRELAEVFTGSYPSIVAVEDTRICGYAYIGPFNDRSAYRFCCEDSIYLRPGHAGKGLGRRMLDTLLQRLKAETRATQVLAKISMPPTAALEEMASCRLHLAFGFREVGRLKKVGLKFGEWLDVVILQLDLENAGSNDA